MISGELSCLVAYLVKRVKRSLESEVDLQEVSDQEKAIEKEDATPAAAPA